MTAATKRARRPCDWCHGELGQEVYTLWLTDELQILVGSCCVEQAARELSRKPVRKVVTRAREVLALLTPVAEVRP